jgi:hypothetical protein
MASDAIIWLMIIKAGSIGLNSLWCHQWQVMAMLTHSGMTKEGCADQWWGLEVAEATNKATWVTTHSSHTICPPPFHQDQVAVPPYYLSCWWNIVSHDQQSPPKQPPHHTVTSVTSDAHPVCHPCSTGGTILYNPLGELWWHNQPPGGLLRIGAATR